MLVTVPLASVTVDASVLEDLAEPFCNLILGPENAKQLCKYQYDGSEHGDASDNCDLPDRPFQVGQQRRGLVVYVDDHYDNYAFQIGPANVGHVIRVLLDPSPGGSSLNLPPLDAPLPNIGLAVWTPACQNLIDFSRSLTGGTQFVEFKPQFAGTYTVQAFLPPNGPSPDVCHTDCADATIAVVGYSIASNQAVT